MTVRIYTDGAMKGNCIGWGFVVVKKNNTIEYEESGHVTGSKELLSQRNVAGELWAVKKALEWAFYIGHKNSVIIVHDYKGCAAWPEGLWKAKNKYTCNYTKIVQFFQQRMRVTFKFVKGHSGDLWNEYVDHLAKLGALRIYTTKQAQVRKYKLK